MRPGALPLLSEETCTARSARVFLRPPTTLSTPQGVSHTHSCVSLLSTTSQLVRTVSFRGEESPVYRFVGPPQPQAQQQQQESGSGSQVSTAPSPSKRSNAFAALDTEDAGDEGEGLDPKVAARLRRLHALVGATTGYGEEEDGAASDAAAASSTASTQGEGGKAGGGLEASTTDLWSMLAGMTPPPAGAAAAQTAPVAAPVATAAVDAEEDIAEEEEEEAQDFGWSAALSASATTTAAAGAAASDGVAEGEEEETSTQSGRPPLSPSPSKPGAAPKPAPAKQQKQKAGGGGHGGDAGEEPWPWSVGLDHRLKERAAEGQTAPSALPPTPPPSRASSTSSLATLQGAGGGGGVANTSVEAGVGAKLLRKMGWQPEGGDAGTPLSALPPAATSVPLPRPERLGLGVPTPAEQASRLAAHEALDAVAGGNAQKKVALMMGGASTQPADAAWEDSHGGSAAQGGKAPAQAADAQPAGHSETQPPESWEQAAVAAASGGDVGPVVALKKVLLAHLRGMEDSLEVATSAALRQGGEEAANELLRRMQKVLDIMQGPVWRGLA